MPPTRRASILMTTANYVPANAAVADRQRAADGVFIDQAQNAYLLPNNPEMSAVLRLGERAYQAVLDDNADPG